MSSYVLQKVDFRIALYCFKHFIWTFGVLDEIGWKCVIMR